MRALTLLALALVLHALPAAAQADGTAEEARLEMRDDVFVPERLEVEPGARVVVTNQGFAPHNVRADDGRSFRSGTVAAGEEGNFTAPAQAGEYAFSCSFHDAMRGVLVVRAPLQATPAPADATPEVTPDVNAADAATPTPSTPTRPRLDPGFESYVLVAGCAVAAGILLFSRGRR